MLRLVIPVEDTIAFTWQNATPAQRAKIVNLFCFLVETQAWQQFTPSNFSKLLDELSDKAADNGLTPEILDEILHES